MSMASSPTVGSNSFLFSTYLHIHLCAVTYIAEISFNSSLSCSIDLGILNAFDACGIDINCCFITATAASRS